MTIWSKLRTLFMPTFEDEDDLASKANPDYQTLMLYGNQPVAHSLPRNYEAFAKEGYRVEATVYKCVSYLSRNGGAIPPILYTDATRQSRIEEHPLLYLLNQPNGEQTGVAYREALLGYLLIAGNSYQYAVRSGNRPPDELWALRPDWMQIIPSAERGITGYQYKPTKEPYLPTDIGHAKYWCPDDALYGLSPFEVAAILIDQQTAARKWNLALLQNWARPPGAWVIPTALGRNERERLEQKLKEKLSGYRNAGAPPVLDGGLTWQTMGVPPAQMDWLSGMQMNAAAIANIFNIPPMVIGDTSATTFDNMKQAEIYSYTEGIFPDLDKLYALWNMWLVPMYPDLKRKRAYLYYDKESVEVIQEMLQAQKDAQSKRATTVYMSGLATLNEAREMQGMAPIPGGDYLRMGATLIPTTFLKKGEFITAAPTGLIASPTANPALPQNSGAGQPIQPDNGRPAAIPQLPPDGQPREPIPQQTGQEHRPASRQAGATPTGKFHHYGGPQAQKRYKVWEAWTEAALDDELQGWEDEGVEYLEWHVMYFHTCDVCQMNEGEIVAVGESFASGDYLPPVHPQCLCEVYPVAREKRTRSPSTSPHNRLQAKHLREAAQKLASLSSPTRDGQEEDKTYAEAMIARERGYYGHESPKKGHDAPQKGHDTPKTETRSDFQQFMHELT